ncbi:MAG: MBG-2 domain-containing protein [Clostridia bacterium]|nr:MBG-2 domain-containing protein [Clostridia bacterium]
MKIFNKKASKIAAVSAMLIAGAFMTTGGATKTAYASTLSEKQNIIKTVSSVENYSLLEKSADDNNYNVSNYVAKYVDTIQTPSFSVINGNELKLTTKGAAKGSCWYNANFFVYTDLSDNLSYAIKNGAISVNASVYLKSGTEKKTDTEDKAYADLYAGVRNGDSSFTNKSTSNSGAEDKNFSSALSVASSQNQGAESSNYLKYEMNLSSSDLAGSEVKSLMLRAHSEFVFDWFVQYNTLYMKDPVLRITTDDEEKPYVSGVTVSDGENGVKTAEIEVADSGSGVYTVSVYDGETLISEKTSEYSGDRRAATFGYELEACKNYKIVITDNVGNTSEYPLAVGGISAEKLFTDKAISFTANLPAIYDYRFTLDKAEPTKNSAPLTELDGVTEAEVAGKGDYVIKVYGFSDSGYAVKYEVSFRVDDTDYIIYKTVKNCTVDLPSAVRYGTTVTPEIVPESGYEPYKIIVDGEETTCLDGFTLTITEDTYIEIICRRRLTDLNPETTEFLYNKSAVELKYLTDADLSAVTFTYNDSPELPSAAGKYSVKWYADNDELVGNGEFTVIIDPLVINVLSVKTEYVYGDSEFVYELSAVDDAITVKFTNALGLAPVGGKPKLPGKYGFEFVSADPSIELDGEMSGNMTIEKAKISFDVSVPFEKFEGIREELEIRLKEKIEEIKDKFKVCLYYEDSEVESIYDAGNYSYTIEIDDELKDLYEVEESDGSFVIEPKTVTVLPGRGQYKYVGQPDGILTYTASEALPRGLSMSGALLREAGDTAGEYPIYIGTLRATDDTTGEKTVNYEVELDSSEQVYYTVLSRKAVVKTFGAKAAFGENLPEVNYAFLYGELAEGDTLTVMAEEKAYNEDGTLKAGTYNLDRIIVTDKNGNDVTVNYSAVVIAGTLTVTPKVITVIPEGFTKVHGQPDGNIGYTAIGPEEKESLDIRVYREAGESAGIYKIRAEIENNPGYEVVVKDAYCTILPETIRVEMQNYFKVYGEADPEFIPLESDLVKKADLAFAREKGETVGEYKIVLASVGNPDYNIEYVPAVLTIEKKVINVKADSLSKVYGEADPELTFTVYGADNDEANVKLLREEGETAGEYEITATSDVNYEVMLNNAVFIILKAEKELDVKDVTVTYDGTAKGIEAGETVTVVYRNANGEVVEAPANAGVYEAEIIFAGDENYNQTIFYAKLTILKKEVTFVIDQSPVYYRGESVRPEFTMSDDVNAVVEWVSGAPDKAGIYYYTITVSSENYYGRIINYIAVI